MLVVCTTVMATKGIGSEDLSGSGNRKRGTPVCSAADEGGNLRFHLLSSGREADLSQDDAKRPRELAMLVCRVLGRIKRDVPSHY